MAACTVAFKPIDPKRDEFRRYLERAGVIEALTKVVIRIVKERPDNPLEYLRTNLGDAKYEANEYAYLQKELEEARNEIKRLRDVIAAADPNALADEKATTTNTSTNTTNANDSQQLAASTDDSIESEENTTKESNNESVAEKETPEKSDANSEAEN